MSEIDNIKLTKSTVVKLFKEQHACWPDDPATRNLALERGLRLFIVVPYLDRIPVFAGGRSMKSTRMNLDVGLLERIAEISIRMGGIEPNAIIRAAAHYALYDRCSPAYSQEYRRIAEETLASA